MTSILSKVKSFTILIRRQNNFKRSIYRNPLGNNVSAREGDVVHLDLAGNKLGSIVGQFPRRLVQRLMLVAICAIGLSACDTELYNKLDQRQANEIVATLFRAGIPAQRVVDKDGQYTVNVDESRFAEAVTILKDKGLPKQEFATLGEVFKNDGIVSSPVQERAQMIYALSQELAKTVSDIDGVLSARVHLVLPQNDPLRQELIPSSASVFLRHISTVPMMDRVPQIKQLVANGIAGLSYDKVSVVPVPVDVSATASGTPDEPELISFLGMWMHRESVARAEWIFYGLAALITALGGVIGYFFWTQRQRVYALPSNGRAKAS